tara:strand:- start:102 stop:677 length:576 start_codon:yes stop_codon:yes gene_type:complete
MQQSGLIPIAEGNQPELFSSDSYEAGEELVKTLDHSPGDDSPGNGTGKIPDSDRRTGRTLERRRGLVQNILKRSAAGLSQRDLSELYGVSRQSIRMLLARAEERGEMEPLRRRVAGKLLTTAELASEEMLRRLEEEPGKIPYKDLSISIGISTQNANLLTGSATSITTKVVVDQTALQARLEELKKEAIDV